MASSLVAQHVTAGYGRKVVIHDQTFSIPTGHIVGLIGPNGGGKSTLFHILNGFEKPMQGIVTLNGTPILKLTDRQRAREIASLPQQPVAPTGVTVRELVSYGRYSQRQWLHRLSPKDKQEINSAIAAVHLDAFKEQMVTDLSGGQRQRAFIAMTLAQNSPIMMLDEPTTYLDLTNQLEILNVLQKLNREFHKTIIVILHDLNLAAEYCDDLICLVHGRIKASGTPNQVITPKILADVFKVKADIIHYHNDIRPQILNMQALVATP